MLINPVSTGKIRLLEKPVSPNQPEKMTTPTIGGELNLDETLPQKTTHPLTLQKAAVQGEVLGRALLMRQAGAAVKPLAFGQIYDAPPPDKDTKDAKGANNGTPLALPAPKDDSPPPGYNSLVFRLQLAERILHQRVVGQNDAIRQAAQLLREHYKIPNGKKPLVLMFIGDSGVGKTELAKAIQVLLSGSERDMIRVDMGTYGQPHNVATLIGSPPGYVGYDNPGLLAGPLVAQTNSEDPSAKALKRVVLFDEVEKADPAVWNLVFPLFDEGYMLDAKGRRAEINDGVIILTSNIGSRALASLGKQRSIGFKPVGPGSASSAINALQDRRKQILKDELDRAFLPEFLNRITEVIQFYPLTEKQQHEIVRRQFQTYLESRFPKKRFNINMENPDSVVNYLAKRTLDAAGNFDTKQGGRRIEFMIKTAFGVPLSEFYNGANDLHLMLPYSAKVDVKVTPDGKDLELSSPDLPPSLRTIKGSKAQAKGKASEISAGKFRDFEEIE